MKLNRNTLKKIESLYEAQGYQVRYEKGSFASGHCIVHDRRIVLINKFFDVPGRVQKLIEILTELEMDEQIFDDRQLKTLRSLTSMWEEEEAS